MTTTVFRKQTHTDRYLDYISHNPIAHKISVVETLFNRADNICTTIVKKDVEKAIGYPMNMIRKKTKTIHGIPPLVKEKPKGTVVIPF